MDHFSQMLPANQKSALNAVAHQQDEMLSSMAIGQLSSPAQLLAW